jgi:hypothetical protein
MPPLNIKSIMVSKKGMVDEPHATPPMPGKVTSIHEHHGGKHVQLEITHGRRVMPKDKAPMAGFDTRPRSTVVMPAAHAKNFTMGQRVGVHVTPMDEPTE